MSEQLRLNIKSDPANLAAVRRDVEGLCQRQGFDDAAVGDIGLCVNEAMANVIRHAYGGATDRPIKVDVDCDPSAVSIRIRDWGNGVDPSRLPPKKHDPMKPGGLGLICLRQMMDEVAFQPQNDGGILLTMKRQRKRQPDSRPASGAA
jgi:anti-sigma regulatory factor (Ser/Thr protein kinase)